MGWALVTGAAGFIGLHLTAELLRRRYGVCALIEAGDEAGRARLLALDPSIRVVQGEARLLCDAPSLPAFDAIFHLAAVGARPGAWTMDALCDVNIRLGCRMVDFARKNGSGLLVHFGSCFEYGDHGGALLTEEMDCRPQTLYAIAKHASTRLTTCYARAQGVNLITVRPFGVFGVGEHPARLASCVIGGCMRGERVRVTAGRQLRDFADVRDLARAAVRLSEAAYAPYGVYNLCSGHPVRVRDFILEICDVCGLNSGLIDFGALPDRAGEPMTLAGDNAKLLRTIDFRFPRSHRDGILALYGAMRAMRRGA